MNTDWSRLAEKIRLWATELGFTAAGISDLDLEQAESELMQWLRLQYHGEMEYMTRHGSKRTRPADLVPGTVRVISVAMDYMPEPVTQSLSALDHPEKGFISRYALGRDYHKLMRNRLQKLATRINAEIDDLGYRAFCDSAPVMEKPLAAKAGLGWVGKHTNLLNRHAGSFFFLGELYINLPLPVDQPVSAHCGSCTACIDICPTRAIVKPYLLDARRCISYLTIELHGSIPLEFRKDLGNRIYGCDDCQLVCPWNRYARISVEPDFRIRHPLHNNSLVELFGWDRQRFEKETLGSAIRRIGYQRWLRNIAVALGNAVSTKKVIEALRGRTDDTSGLVREHVNWALSQHQESKKSL